MGQYAREQSVPGWIHDQKITIFPSKPRIINFIATILKIPKLQDYLVLAVVVRELSKHQSASCLIVAFVIARFASLSCYSSAKTRIRLVKSYQINESFCSITHCASLCIVYCLIVVSMHFQCPELQVRLWSSPHYLFLSLNLNPNPHLNRIFDFSIMFSHGVSVRVIAVLTLRTCKSMQVPFNI